MMLARTPTEGEIEAAAEVAAQAFPHLSMEHWRESFYTTDKMFGREFIVVVELDGKIVSSLLCCPAPIYVGKGTVSHSSVGGVGTLPQYRAKGCAAAMMSQTVRLLREQGIHTSSLWPFSYEYYRKFGWEVGSETRRCSAPAEVFANFGDSGRVRFARVEDFDRIKASYDSHAPFFNCLTELSSEWWTKIARLSADCLRRPAEGARGTLVHTARGLNGYAVYNREPQSIEIKEMFFDRLWRRRDALAFLAAHYPKSRINFDAALDDTLLHELPNPRAVEVSVHPSFQFRVIDPPQAMLALIRDECISAKVSFSISDPVFEEGFKFGVDIDAGRISLTPYDESRALKMDVQTFAKLYSGYLRPMEGWMLGKIEMDMQALSDACMVFSPQTPYRTWLEPG